MAALRADGDPFSGTRPRTSHGLVRRYLPDLGGIDLSPIVLLLGVQFLRNLLVGFLQNGS